MQVLFLKEKQLKPEISLLEFYQLKEALRRMFDRVWFFDNIPWNVFQRKL